MTPASVRLPDGTYFTVAHQVGLDRGGRTRALLMRSRMINEIGDVPVTILTYSMRTDLEENRKVLLEQGLLSEGVRMLSIFDHFRTAGLSDRSEGKAGLPALPGYARSQLTHPDGTPHGTTYTKPGDRKPSLIDLRRPDGSVYLRAPVTGGRHSAPFALVDEYGAVVRTWERRRDMLKDALCDLAPTGQDAFVVCDSPSIANRLLELPDRFHVAELFHNPHVLPPYRWDGIIAKPYRRMMRQTARLGGLVTLTERQRDDVLTRLGPVDNVFVVPNPVVMPRPPDPLPGRDPTQFVVVSRLTPQKRLEHALRGFARASRTNPSIRLDVYGDGGERPGLEGLARSLEIADAVTFHGFDPRARDVFWTAAAMLVTSRFEGYPLATLEAMSAGCPVIGYDVKYGLREQVVDGVNGFLLEDGDLDGLVEAILALAASPDTIASMSAAATRIGREHGPARHVSDWARVFRGMTSRSTIEACRLSESRLQSRGRRWRRPGPTTLARPLGAPASYEGVLTLVEEQAGADQDNVTKILLQVFGDNRGDLADIAVDSSRSSSAGITTISVRGSVDPRAVVEQIGDTEQAVRLRLVLARGSFTWRTDVARGRVDDGGRLRLVAKQSSDSREPTV